MIKCDKIHDFMKWKEEKLFNGNLVRSLDINGGEFDVSEVSIDWYNGPKKFNLFFADFGNLFTDLVENIIKPELRIRENNDNLKSLSFISDDTNVFLEKLIEIVNFSSRPLISEDRKKQYKMILSRIANSLLKYRSEENFSKECLTIVPLKGGSYFWDFLKDKEDDKKTLAIDCKRIPLIKKNTFGFGMRIDSEEEYKKSIKLLSKFESNNFEKIRIVELCIVSGMTTLGFLLFLERNNIKPKEIEINTVALSQQGYEFISDYAKSKKINVRFITGGMYYRLGNYYLSKTDELLTLDGKLVIGDVRSFLD